MDEGRACQHRDTFDHGTGLHGKVQIYDVLHVELDAGLHYGSHSQLAYDDAIRARWQVRKAVDAVAIGAGGERYVGSNVNAFNLGLRQGSSGVVRDAAGQAGRWTCPGGLGQEKNQKAFSPKDGWELHSSRHTASSGGWASRCPRAARLSQKRR